MAAISSGIGLVSGLNINQIVTALVCVQQTATTQLQTQETGIKSQKSGIDTLSANLLSLSTSATQFAQASSFTNFNATSSDSQLSATAASGATPGSYQFQTLRLASAQQ